MSDNELINYIKQVETNFESHIENGSIEMSLEYYNLCEELMARGINAIQENKKLKEQLEECQLQNLNLREDIMIKKMSFPNKEIKDKSFLELYDMPSYEDLKNENQQLKEQLQQKEDIINEAIKYIKTTLEKNMKILK